MDLVSGGHPPRFVSIAGTDRSGWLRENYFHLRGRERCRQSGGARLYGYHQRARRWKMAPRIRCTFSRRGWRTRQKRLKRHKGAGTGAWVAFVAYVALLSLTNCRAEGLQVAGNGSHQCDPPTANHVSTGRPPDGLISNLARPDARSPSSAAAVWSALP